MKRIYALFVLLVMVLSCGNSPSNQLAFKPSITINNPNLKETKNLLSKEETTIASKLDVLFTNYNKVGSFNGSILVARAGKVIFKKALGISDKQLRRPITDSSMFQLASVSKVITATAVLILHERQLLDINKPFKFYFPDFPYDGVAIKELLNHRSGLPNYIYTLNKEFYKPNYRMTNEDMYNYFVSKNTRRYCKPNHHFDYSNTNYALLGLLIEKVSGKPYQEFLKEELFMPLGMKNTATIRDIDLNAPKTTKPYDTRWRPVSFDASDYVLGDKSIYSTPYDLFLFSEAMYQNKVLKPETQNLAYTAFSREMRVTNYGYGWRMKDFNNPEKKEVYHNGWWHGYRSSFHRRLKDTLTVVILSNQLNHAAYQTHKVYEIIDNTVLLPNQNEEE